MCDLEVNLAPKKGSLPTSAHTSRDSLTQFFCSNATICRDSKVEKYQKMWRYMESNEPETFVSSYEEGVRRVLRGNYAFLCESTMLHYLLQRNCNLTQVGGLLDNKVRERAEVRVVTGDLWVWDLKSSG